MCGDGANDCGALKAAHAGVSLSVAEASVAAPFTSKKMNVSCIIPLISEGRASLVSCMGIFKYQVADCFVILIITLILMYQGLKPSDPQYLYVDIFISLIPAITFGNCAGNPEVVKKKPVKKLLGIVPLVSMFTFLIIHLLMNIETLIYCKSQPWFTNFVYTPGKSEVPPTYEVTALFSNCVFSVMAAVVVFSEGSPFRRPLYTNKILTVFLSAMFIFSCFVIISPTKLLETWLNLKLAPIIYYQIMLVGIGIAHSLLSYLLEVYVVRRFVASIICSYFKRYNAELYEKLADVLKKDTSWPPVDQTLHFKTEVANLVMNQAKPKARDRSKSTVSAISAISV